MCVGGVISVEVHVSQTTDTSAVGQMDAGVFVLSVLL